MKGSRVVLARTPDFLTLAGTVRVPAAKRNVEWDEVIRRTRIARAEGRRRPRSSISKVASFDRSIDRIDTIERIEPPPV